jgi:hypothetical protein
MPGVALAVAIFALGQSALATEIHVAVTGRDTNPGTRAAPLRSIQQAAELAQPGDTVTVHAGIYRERVNPPRGGTSEAMRIVYRAAPGEHVEIRGSEVVTGWEHVRGSVWKSEVPNRMFGSFNPFSDVIHGDWFDPRGRVHHTGAVYLNGEWLAEAASLDELYLPDDAPLSWLAGDGEYLLNVAWLRAGGRADRIAATSYAGRQGKGNAPCDEGGDCIGWIESGDWTRYDRVDFGERSDEMELRVASASEGGTIEIRLDSPTGERLGACDVPNSGGWQSWTSVKARIKPVSGIRTLCLVYLARNAVGRARLWYAQVGDSATTVWAQFPGVNPNAELVEINVRQTVFYPDRPGRDYITVRGFAMRQAAAPWAPPTAEQIGVIGPHWSRGWIIERNVVSHSTCSGIALGKYGDEWDNRSGNSAEGYVKTIERGLANGWNRDTIGHHLVRDNEISHCEQAGIVGSLGAAFSTVTNNTIHEIHMRRYFSGAEMAGIKFHGAIDTVIAGNHIYRTCLGIWLDWMAQGARVSRNLFHDNGTDLFVEVDHGPFVVDNNLFLSPSSLLDVSEGGAFLHNLFLGLITTFPDLGRQTPYHQAHSTTVAGLSSVKGGDDRFFNNIFAGSADHGLFRYDHSHYPLLTGGNVYYGEAKPYAQEIGAAASPAHDLKAHLTTDGDRLFLEMEPGAEPSSANASLVTTALLGRAKVPDLPYENADGSALTIDLDFLGRRRNLAHVLPGPFAALKPGRTIIRLR